MATLKEVMECLTPMLEDRHIVIEDGPIEDPYGTDWIMRLRNPNRIAVSLTLTEQLVEDATDGDVVCGHAERSGILDAIATATSHRRLILKQSGRYVELTE